MDNQGEKEKDEKVRGKCMTDCCPASLVCALIFTTLCGKPQTRPRDEVARVSKERSGIPRQPEGEEDWNLQSTVVETPIVKLAGTAPGPVHAILGVYQCVNVACVCVCVVNERERERESACVCSCACVRCACVCLCVLRLESASASCKRLSTYPHP